MLAAPLVAWAILTHSWQFAFVLTGVIGLAWVALWLAFYQSPAKHKALSPEERHYILSGQERHLAGEGRPSFPTILRQRNFWGIAIPRFLADPTWGTLTFWLPLYLTTVRGFDLKQIAMFAWLPFLAADLGCMVGGTISLALQKRGVGLINARRTAFTVGALLMMGVAFVGIVDSPYVAVALLSLAGFAHQTLSVTVITMASDLFKRSEVATVAGMDIVQLLLDHGADPNLPEEQIAPKGKALYSAVSNGHYEIAKLLLERGAFPNPPVESSGDALWWSRERRPDKRMEQLLVSYGARPTTGNTGEEWPTRALNWLRISPLHEAARKGDVPEAKKLLEAGADLTARDEHLRSTPLAWAAKFGQLEMVKFLLRCGAPKSLPDDPSWATPLAWAKRHGHGDIVDLLVRHGAT